MQTTVTRDNNRGYHVWHYRKKEKNWKCVLCGAVSANPGEELVKEDWMPERYEPLTDEERNLSPYVPKPCEVL
jgi:hypothetical protein